MRPAFDAVPRLEKYELIEELGHGGMATVYRARDRRLGREVAVKVIHRHLRDEREVKERFYREAKAVAKLRHPGIVEVYDVSEPHEPERYLVVELVRGITLRQLIREHSPLPTELAIGIGAAVADALFHAHEQGVVHRDVKPENVLLELPEVLRTSQKSETAATAGSQVGAESRRAVAVKITDFGIAKVLDAQGVTATGEVLGSPAHMAPEQIEGHSVGPKADLFSLGVLIYECVVGHLPFRGNNPAQVLRRVLDGDFIPTERARPEAGALIGQLIDRALSHNPDERFGNAGEFAEALRGELRRVQITEPLQLLGDYLFDSAAFLHDYEPRLVASIVEQAQRERRAGAIVTAAALYNRALALRPGDSAILLDVARLMRLRRRKTQILSALAVFAIAAMCTAGLWGGRLRSTKAAQLAHSATASGTLVAPAVSLPEPVALPTASDSVGLAPANSAKWENPSAVRAAPTVTYGSRAATRPPATPMGKRVVQVVLSGAAGSRLLIDGVERPWFGVKHELEFGEHRFDVVPPNEQCCAAPGPKTVKIVPGEGDFRIVLAVEFRDAILQLTGNDGATLSCGELFPGILAAPGRRSVRVSRPETRASCTLVPALDSGERPRTIDVVLRPGGTFTVSGT